MKTSIILFHLMMFNIALSHAQSSLPDSAFAFPLNEKIILDGNPDEKAWKNAKSVTAFTQIEPALGKPATNKTKVSLTYSSSALYIGVWCYQNPATISAKSLQRDFDFEGEDNFRIVINPFNEGRTGYEFVINPYGARTDLLITTSEDVSTDWNGVWDAVATITNEGWFAEIEIPFNTLKFKNSPQQIWTINFERNVRNQNETDRWKGLSRDFTLENFAVAGNLCGLKNISYSKKFELKPYLLGGWNLSDDKVSYTGLGKIGADLNYNITPTLKLNLTANTDFAQVEADVIQVNLTRFNLYYPEKRDFFLEGAGNFDFYIGSNNNVFYSRKIGIENFQSVNVFGGARLFGKINKSNIGFLSLQTAANQTTPTVNNSVFRYKYDLGSQSYIGSIITSKLSAGHQNFVAGIDGNYAISHFLKNKNFVIGALITASSNDGKIKDNSLAWRLYCDYPNDLVDNFIGISSSQKNFSPELGFLSRTNYESFTWNLRYNPRWFTQLGIRKMLLKPWEFTVYRTQSTHELESYFNESRPLGFMLQTGDSFEFNLQQSYDRIDNPFELTKNITVDKGKYHMYASEFQLNSFRGRKFFAELLYKWGTLYDGKINTAAALIGININKHLNLTEQFEYNQLNINSKPDNIQQLISSINYAFTTKLDFSLLGQYNSQEEQLLTNFRIHWIPEIGSDFYFVFNNGYDPVKRADYLRPTINSGAAKIVWRFTF